MIIVQSKNMKREIIDYFKISESKIQIIYNPIDFDEIDNLKHKKIEEDFDSKKINLLEYKDNPYSYMYNSDILILTSNRETFPNVVL